MKTAYKSQQLIGVGDNLDRNGEDVYYARLHHKGKSYKKCLDTHDRKTAERKLIEFEKQIERQALETPDLLDQNLCLKWHEAIKPSLKQSTYYRFMAWSLRRGILVKTTHGHLRKGFGDDMAKLMTFKG